MFHGIESVQYLSLKALSQSVRPRFCALPVLGARPSGHSNRSHNFSVHHERNPSLDRRHSSQTQHPRSSRRGRGVLKRLRRPLEQRRRPRLINGHIRAPQLCVVHLFVVHQIAACIHDRHGHIPVIFFRLRHRGRRRFLRVLQCHTRPVWIRHHLRFRAHRRKTDNHARNDHSHCASLPHAPSSSIVRRQQFLATAVTLYRSLFGFWSNFRIV